MKIEKTITVSGARVILTATPKQTRFGQLWVASNNYGEPSVTQKGYYTAAEALSAEEAQVRKMLNPSVTVFVPTNDGGGSYHKLNVAPKFTAGR